MKEFIGQLAFSIFLLSCVGAAKTPPALSYVTSFDTQLKTEHWHLGKDNQNSAGVVSIDTAHGYNDTKSIRIDSISSSAAPVTITREWDTRGMIRGPVVIRVSCYARFEAANMQDQV